MPLSLVEKVALVGPNEKIAEEWPVWRDSLITTMLIGGTTDTLPTMAEIAG